MINYWSSLCISREVIFFPLDFCKWRVKVDQEFKVLDFNLVWKIHDINWNLVGHCVARSFAKFIFSKSFLKRCYRIEGEVMVTNEYNIWKSRVSHSEEGRHYDAEPQKGQFIDFINSLGYLDLLFFVLFRFIQGDNFALFYNSEAVLSFYHFASITFRCCPTDLPLVV